MDKTHLKMLQPHLPDDITVKHWLAFYAVFFTVLAVPLAVLLANQQGTWADWLDDTTRTFSQTSVAIKLLVMTLWLSMACTFLPLPTGWIVAGVATRQAAVANGMSDSVLVVALLTALIVAVAGAVGSTIANLNDYHLFTWMLRHHRIGAVRKTRAYQSAAKWFARQPFFLILVFNIIPIPVDFVRMLATTYRYPRGPFAAANFAGRLIRYATIAFVTFWWDLGIAAPIALLALAVVLGAGRLGPKLVRRILADRANPAGRHLSNTTQGEKEQHV